ncbi:unnamed protein product, partial [Polarella glacialis]
VVEVATPGDRQLILRSLRYVKARRGRCLFKKINHLGLKSGDRLEPSTWLQDIAKFETMTVPFKVLFWRCSKRDRVTHPSPVLEIEGVTVDTWGIDLLHSWVLGPLGNYIAKSILLLISSKPYCRKSLYLDAEACQRVSLLALKGDLMNHYAARRASDSNWKAKGSQVWNLTIKMLGSADNPRLSAKAAETHGLLKFVVETLAKHEHNFEESRAPTASLLLQAGRAAVKFDDTLNQHSGRPVSSEMCQQLLFSFTRFACLFEKAGGKLTPKCHLMVHLADRARTDGHPRAYHTYKDESMNGVIARIAQSCHHATWTESVLRKFTIRSFYGVRP